MVIKFAQVTVIEYKKNKIMNYKQNLQRVVSPNNMSGLEGCILVLKMVFYVGNTNFCIPIRRAWVIWYRFNPQKGHFCKRNNFKKGHMFELISSFCVG